MSDTTRAETPRHAVADFLRLTREGRYAESADLLDLPDSLRPRGAEIARELRAIIDRYGDLDPDASPDQPHGDSASSGPVPVVIAGTVTVPHEATRDLSLVRTPGPAGIRWRFSRSVVDAVPQWAEALDDRWAIDYLPDALLREGPFDIRWWQWLALPVLALLASLLGAVVGRVVVLVARRVARRTETAWDEIIVTRLRGPAIAGSSLLAFALLLPFVALYPVARHAVYLGVQVASYAVFFWILWQLIDAARVIAEGATWLVDSPARRSLLPLAGRVAKIAVAAVAVVAILSELGYPVGSLLTGLGIGGVAVALAGQKTVENLFGAFSIGIDQPLRVGDLVQVGAVFGNVEAIGLRSTRIRTLDRTLVTIPNGALSETQIESFTARDRFRLLTTVSLIYGTSASQMRSVLAGLEATLRAHPRIWADEITVRLREFGASSLDIEVMAWFRVTDMSEFRRARQDVLLGFMDVIEASGTALALPARAVRGLTGQDPRIAIAASIESPPVA
jgi:MscS family membrane protein